MSLMKLIALKYFFPNLAITSWHPYLRLRDLTKGLLLEILMPLGNEGHAHNLVGGGVKHAIKKVPLNAVYKVMLI